MTDKELRKELRAIKVRLSTLGELLRITLHSEPSEHELVSKRPSIATIQRETAGWFNLRVQTLCGRSRDTHIVFPRQIAMTLCLELSGHGSTPIAKAFSRKDHGTVLWARNAVKDRCDIEPRTKDSISALRRRILKAVHA